MTFESDISQIVLCTDDSKEHFSEIHMHSDQVQRPSWQGLQEYWDYATAEEVEYLSASHCTCHAVFCFTCASGQGGVIAVWNTSREKWEHVSEAAHVTCAMILEKIKAIVSFHYVYTWGTPAKHSVWVTPFNGILDGSEDISIPIKSVYSKKGFDPANIEIKQSAFGNYTDNASGPLGIFLLHDNEMLAHDAGNLHQFSINDIQSTLKSKNIRSE